MSKSFKHMTEEQYENLDSQNEAEEADTSEEQTAEGQEDGHDELTEREKQFLARAKKAESKLKELKGSEKKDNAPKKPNKNGIDYGQLAFHNSKSDSARIEHEDDIDFLQKTMEDTGKSQKDLLGAKWFISELKEMQETRATADAVPKNGRRAQTSPREQVDYWLNKKELPSDPELRRKVVNARITREKSANNSTGSSVITNSSGIDIR